MSFYLKAMLYHSLIIFSILTMTGLCSCKQNEESKQEHILVITGGHEFEPSFFSIFDSFTGIGYDTVSQPGFNRMVSTGFSKQYSALVFYDMWQNISAEQKQGYLKLLDEGQGMLFLHHSLVSYQNWDEFIKIVGGKYVERGDDDNPNIKGSTYTENITMNIKVVSKGHPVTSGVSDFSIYDEGYQYIEMLAGITPLLTTNHPNCSHTVAWAHRYKNSRIVYIMLGHGHQAYENANYRKLVSNAIHWVGEKK